METQERPAECRAEEVEQIYRCDPKADGFRLRGTNIARASRGTLRRFARDKQIPFADGDTKLALYSAIDAYLRQIGWDSTRDIVRLPKAKL